MKGNVEYIEEGRIFHGNIPHVMGTRLELLTIGVPQDVMSGLWDSLYDMVFGLDRMLNRFDDASEVARLNLSDNPLEMEMSPELVLMTGLADVYNTMTCGLFDITDSDGKLDFGGFGKGYFLKKCRRLLEENGVECAFVDFGGSSILALGTHPYGDSWKVGVVNPYTRLTIKEISLADKAMSTSGNTPSYSGHIRNPLTGRTDSGRRMVSVVCDDPLDAEVLSTVLMIADSREKETICGNYPSAVWEEFNL